MILTFGNFKGGVGKTTSSLLFAYILAELKSKKVLLVDTDPQSNLTEIAKLTYHIDINNNKNIFNASFKKIPTEKFIQPLSSNMDILAGSWDMISFETQATKLYKSKTLPYIFQSLLKPLESVYDFIIVDTAPTTNLVTDNAIVATDYVVISTQTVPLAFESTKKYYQYLERMNAVSDDFELLGVIPYLVGRSATDRKFLSKYKEFFQDDLFNSIIKSSDRVKSWSNDGITTDQPHDQNTLNMYVNVVDEALERIKEYEADEK